MKRFLCLLLLASSLGAQQTNFPSAFYRSGSGAPTAGTCSTTAFYNDTTNHILYIGASNGTCTAVGGTGSITGTGTLHSIPVWTAAQTQGNSTALSEIYPTFTVNESQATNGTQAVIGDVTTTQLTAPSTLACVQGAATGGFLLHNQSYFYKVTAISANGQTTVSNESTFTTAASPVPDTYTASCTWTGHTGDTGYKLYRSTGTGTEVLLATITPGNTNAYTDNTNTTPSGAMPTVNSTGTLTAAGQIIGNSSTTAAIPAIAIGPSGSGLYNDGFGNIAFATNGAATGVNVSSGAISAGAGSVYGAIFSYPITNTGVTIQGGLDAATTGTAGILTARGENVTAGGSNNLAGGALILQGGQGTGTATPAPVKIQSGALGLSAANTVQPLITRYVTHVKAGSTTSATPTTLFNIASATNTAWGMEILVHVDLISSTPNVCGTTERFSLTGTNNNGAFGTVNIVAGTISTLCSTGTLTLAVSATAANPSVISVTPTWVTIASITSATITVQIQNVSQQEIALL